MPMDILDTLFVEEKCLDSFFMLEDTFWEVHGLSDTQMKAFTTFLKCAELMKVTRTTSLVKIVKHIGWKSDTAWGIILVNLAVNNPQVMWYIRNFEISKNYSKDVVLNMLQDKTINKDIALNVYETYRNMLKMYLGTSLNFGTVKDDGTCIRTKCSISDPRVILYALFKFAENRTYIIYSDENFKTILNHVFGLSDSEIIPIAKSLSEKYPDFISYKDMQTPETITLARNKKTTDILTLFWGEHIEYHHV